MTAAKAVTSATRPLNLYYGCSTGLPITAVHQPDPYTFSRHGLVLGDTKPTAPRYAWSRKEKERFSESRRQPGPKRRPGEHSALKSVPDLCEKAPLRNSQHLSALYIIPEAGPFNVSGDNME